MNQYEAIKAALTARGETLMKRHAKFEQWSRRFAAKRDKDGNLKAANQKTFFWFLGHRSGALRLGQLSGGSYRASADAKSALVHEGRAISKA